MLFGLSFMVRFQMGFAHAAFGLWLITAGRVRDFKRLAPLATGFIFALGFSVMLDRWGYGEWVLTPWAYYVENIIRGHAASFGTAPWSYYAQNLWETLPPLGALLLLGSLLGCIRRPWHVLTFTLALFFLGNAAVAHKESRFLFPMATAVPVVVALGLANGRNYFQSRLLNPVLILLLVIDLGAMLVMSLKPALAQIHFYETVYRHTPAIDELWHGELDPYAPFKLKINYYRPDGMKEREFSSLKEFQQNLRPDRDLWLFYENFELVGDAQSLAPVCHLEYTTFPAWLKNFTFLPGPRKFANRWSLYRCRLAL
jgi:phosphatidylinositol glycan class B